jgi:hypothetical protein
MLNLFRSFMHSKIGVVIALGFLALIALASLAVGLAIDQFIRDARQQLVRRKRAYQCFTTAIVETSVRIAASTVRQTGRCSGRGSGKHHKTIFFEV